jgi:hypothetical protein
MEGMLDGVALWEERRKWEEDERNSGLCRVVVMGRGWRRRMD